MLVGDQPGNNESSPLGIHYGLCIRSYAVVVLFMSACKHAHSLSVKLVEQRARCDRGLGRPPEPIEI